MHWFSLASDAEPQEARRVAVAALPWVSLLAGHLHEAVRRVSGLLQQQNPDLSPRELECLRGVADGKTSGEIAQLLGMSERTVNFHLQNAVQKLDVANRQHAVVKAAPTGRDVGAFTISNQAMESEGGGRMNDIVTTKDGARYQCYIYEAPPLARITTFGMAPTTSDAVCTHKGGGKPGKGAQKDASPACNALLKAAGRC